MVGKLLSVDLGDEASRMFGVLSKHSLTRRLEADMARRMRAVILEALTDAIKDSRASGKFPYRTGRGYINTLKGGRAFGTRFAQLRGHILAPDYIVAHNKGTRIVPKNSSQLAIPLPPALRPDGTPKLPGPRSWQLQGSFVYKSKRTGKGYIARKDAAGNLILLYVFVDFAQLRKHKGFINSSWEKELVHLFEEWGNIFRTTIEAVDTDEFITAGVKARKPIRS